MIQYRQPFEGTYPITQGYGEVIPGVTYKGQPHTGLDYACPTGTPILASADGVVIAAQWHDSYGYYVKIQHNDTFATLYGHCSSIAVSVGQTVSQGQTIGYVGSTGNSTGPHLHFEVRINGATTNPHAYVG